MKPLIKYSGSKFPFLSEIKTHLPQNYGKVFIPFCGGGSFITLFRNKEIYVSDLLPDVIRIFSLVKEAPEFINMTYKEHYENLLKEGEPYYYKVRDIYNNQKFPQDFLWLTRTAFNGLIRFNPKGEFNVSFHHNRNGIQPQKFNEIIYDWCELFNRNRIEFVAEDYRDTLKHCKEGDIVILDPPYLATKGQYLTQIFNFDELIQQLNLLTEKKVRWIMTMDDDIDLSMTAFYDLQKSHFLTTAKQSSSFSRLKLNNKLKGNTLIRNYL